MPTRFFLFLMLCVCSAAFRPPNRVVLVANKAQKKIEVLIDGKLFTAYIFLGAEVLKKAVLYPIRTASGTVITRGWPLDPRPNERIDHPHHVGMWLNYESVNGHDFWNNSTAIDPAHSAATYGTIVHSGIQKMQSGRDHATLVVTADWLDKNGQKMLGETTTYVFSGHANRRTIDRITTLTALDSVVVFKDVKDGMFAIRLARELEHPAKTPEIFTDANGIATTVPALNNDGVSGNYLNSNGIEGEAAWGKRAKWCDLRGTINNENIHVVIFDHPKNVGFPTYWHARGYGLFAANPLGQKVFSNGKEQLNFKLLPRQTTTFRFRTVIQTGELNYDTTNQIFDDFSTQY